MFDFKITSRSPVSDYFLKQRLTSFQQAASFVKKLPYKRNADKENLLSIFTDGHATCSTKHGILKQLATENGHDELELILGIYRMNGLNTPKVKDTLQSYHLHYLPEAHNYLKLENKILDYTFPNSFIRDLEKDILEEIIIQPCQITDFKISYHTTYLKKWLIENPDIPYSIDELWKIRELCIQALSKK